MNEKFYTPMTYMFRARMSELLHEAMVGGTIARDRFGPYALGYSVFGGDPLLQRSPSMVLDIVVYQLGGLEDTEEFLDAIARGMKDRMYADEFNRD